MQNAANIATILVAALHVYILILEMFLWCTPKGMKTFGLTPEFAAGCEKGSNRLLAFDECFSFA